MNKGHGLYGQAAEPMTGLQFGLFPLGHQPVSEREAVNVKEARDNGEADALTCVPTEPLFKKRRRKGKA